MQLPGRHGFATETGDWHGSYGYSLPDYLTVNVRNNNTPLVYTAGIQVTLDNGFTTGLGDDNYEVYISDSAMAATADSAYQLVANGYSYGFNGQEHSTELNNDDYTAQFWEYDGRTGRRWNREVYPNPAISDYATFLNNPILNADPTGAQPGSGNNNDPFSSFWYRIKQYFASKFTSPNNQNVDRSEEQQVFNAATDGGIEKMKPVVKVVNQAKIIVAGFIPGGSSYQELKKGNYTAAAMFGVVDLFGGEIIDGTGKLLAKTIGKGFLKSTGKVINSILEDVGNASFKNSFEQSGYKIMEAQQDMVVYRFSGGSSLANKGEFFSTKTAKNSTEANEMLNIWSWGNTGEQITPITIKKGTQFAYGKVAGGTGFQVFIPKAQQAGNVIRHIDKTVSIAPGNLLKHK